MDLNILQKKALLIPTPGQTEQEYIGENLSSSEQFEVQNQTELDIARAWKKLNSHTPKEPLPAQVQELPQLNEILVRALNQFLERRSAE